MSTTSTDRSWRTVEITQDCSYGWTLDLVSKFLDGWSCVKDYAYILHDLDFKEDCKTPRDAHIHLLLRFKYAVHTSAILARAASVCAPEGCVTDNRLEKVKSWSGAVNYLTHRDEQLPHKHIYEPSCVISNFDWELASSPAHSRKEMQVSPAREKEIIDRICSGEVREYNIGDFLSDYERIVLDRKIRLAFNIYYERVAKEERKMKVMFISGPSGVGKDTFAREWCRTQGLDYFCTNNNDKFPFDDYKGEPVIIWSDARDDVFKPHNLHQLLDNHFQSTQHARFYDRCLNCKFFIITSITPIEQWYKSFYEKEREDRVQLYRRVGAVYEMTDKVIRIKLWNNSKLAYDYLPGDMPNTYRYEVNLDDPSVMRQVAKDFLGAMASNFQFASDHFDDPAFMDADDLEVPVPSVVLPRSLDDDDVAGQLSFDDLPFND